MNQNLGISMGGILPAMSALGVAEQQRKASELAQAQPLITSIASYVRNCWTEARTAKEQTVEPKMFKAVRARRGEYDPDVLTMIRQNGGSEIYMMLTSNKCRAAASWLRDVLLGQGADKPWTIRPTPTPTLSPDIMEEMRLNAIQQMAQVIETTGQQLPPTQLRKFLNELREEYMHNVMEEAKFKVKQMENKMEDQLIEGGFITALAQGRRLIRSIQKCSPLQLRLHTLLLTIRHTGWDPLQRIRIGAVCLELQAARV